MEGCVQIGQITKDPKTGKTRIERDWYRQGWVVKDEEAFLLHPDQPCYVPELSDTVYTGDEIRRLCNHQEELARACFDLLDWQCPETFIEEQFRDLEWGWCPKCRKIVSLYGEEGGLSGVWRHPDRTGLVVLRQKGSGRAASFFVWKMAGNGPLWYPERRTAGEGGIRWN